MEECERLSVQTLPVLGQTATSVEPSDRPLDDPALRQNRETVCRVRSLDDFHLDLPEDTVQGTLELRPLVAAIGVELEQKRMQAEDGGHQKHAAITVLDVRRVHDGMEQQALCVYQDVTLLALDFLARVIAMRVGRPPPFSALFTLWLSMIAAVGLASRPASARHCTYSAW